MNKQSSATVFCRAVVMLACLVAIPLAAVFGTSLPRTLQSLLAGRWDGSWSSALDSLETAQSFGQPADETPLPAANNEHRSAGLGDQQRRPMAFNRSAAGDPLRSSGGSVPPLAASAEQLSTNQPAGAIPVNYDALVGSSPAASSGTGSGTQPAAATSRGLAPLSPPGAKRLPPPDTQVRPAGGPANGVRVAPTDQFVYIQNRLRQLGATYYLLESWGVEGQLYRFYCKMAVGGNPDCNRYFEATDVDALRAMAKVLTEVETWKNDRW